ncbi:MAG: glycosyltransferase family 4 protein [bacterium]|nr:glycosyltransferase family 4 protein [bacterium]
MKIAFLSSRFPPDFIGGGEWSTKYIAEGLVALGHDVTVICGAEENKEEIINGLKVKRVKALFGLWDKPLLEKRKSKKLALVLKKELDEKFDIVHAHDFRTAQALALLNLPNAVVTIRDFAPICGTTNNMLFDGQSCNGCTLASVCFKCHRVREASFARKPFRIWQYKFNLAFRNETYQNIKNQIYISEALRSRVVSRLELPKNTAVISNPVSPDWLQPIMSQFPPLLNGAAGSPKTSSECLRGCQRRHISAVLGGGGFRNKIVYAGTVDDYKGVKILIDAFAKFQKIEKDVELIIIGKGKIAEYQKYIAQNCIDISIQFVGKKTQEEVREYFDEALVIVQPSIWEEPFGRTIIEAYARGRAVVASNVGGIKETFKEGTGYLVKPGSVDELHLALKKIVENKEETQKMGEIGRAYVEQNFTAQIVAQKYLDYYNHATK